MAGLDDHTIVPTRRSQVRMALEQMDVFGEFPSDLMDELAAEFRVAEVEAGTVVVQQGGPGDRLFVVDSGELDVSITVNGNEVQVGELGRGEFFGETAIVMGTPRTATVTARTPARLWTLSAENLGRWLERVPELRQRVADIVRRRQLGAAFSSLQ